jgi:hypothetical protein
MSLLGLILGSLLERNLAQPEVQRGARALAGDVVVQAGKMTVSLRFDGGDITVVRGAVEQPRAQVVGSLEALMNLALGGGMVGPWLSGRLKTRGSLITLLRMRRLLQVGEA